MIPKIIHQTAKTKDIPSVWKKYQKKVQELHPDWEYRFWTDEDNLQFVKKEFPEYFELFVGLPKNIMRADVIRYLIMYKIGGLYLDLDYEMIKPFEYLNHDLVLPLSKSKEEGDSIDGIGNCIFASAPNQPFWMLVMKKLTDNPPLAKNVDVEASTGPTFLSELFFSSKENQTNIYTPKREIFHPVTPWSNRGHRQTVSKGVAHGIHHCTGTWREKTIKRKLNAAIKFAIGTIIKK